MTSNMSASGNSHTTNYPPGFLNGFLFTVMVTLLFPAALPTSQPCPQLYEIKELTRLLTK